MNNDNIRFINGNELDGKQLPETNWIIEDLLPEGLCILAGAPKSGKSLFALNMSISLSSGNKIFNHFETSKKAVAYIPFEDSEGRIQRHQRKIKTGLKITDTESLYFPEKCFFPKLNETSLYYLENLIKDKNIKLVVIDTLGSGLEQKQQKSYSVYYDEYQLLSSFQRFALNNHISLVIIHHTRKMKAENVFDEISGTRGITGASDVNSVLQKSQPTSYLSVQGQELEDQRYEMVFKKEYLIWEFKNKLKDDHIELTPEQKRILESFGNDYEKEMMPNEIADIIDKTGINIRPNIAKLMEYGLLRQENYGKYKLSIKN